MKGRHQAAKGTAKLRELQAMAEQATVVGATGRTIWAEPLLGMAVVREEELTPDAGIVLVGEQSRMVRYVLVRTSGKCMLGSGTIVEHPAQPGDEVMLNTVQREVMVPGPKGPQKALVSIVRHREYKGLPEGHYLVELADVLAIIHEGVAPDLQN